MAKNPKKIQGFSDEEKEAMRERAQELRAGKDNGEEMVLAKIKAMKGQDYEISKRLHKLIKENAPMLTPKTWYGMPAYADKQGRIICFFQSAARFKSRYLTLGFSDKAHIDDGETWPVMFAITKLTTDVEKKIVALVKKAVN